jgi:hypothetical protein
MLGLDKHVPMQGRARRQSGILAYGNPCSSSGSILSSTYEAFIGV